MLACGIIVVKVNASETNRRRIFAVLSLATYIALKLGIPHLAVPKSPRAASALLLLTVLAFMAAQIALIRWVSSLGIRARYAAVLTVVAAVAFVAVHKLRLPTGIGSELLLLTALCMFGCLASRMLREPNLLLPAALFAPIFDIWTVFFGPAHEMVKRAPKLVQAVSATVPGPGSLKPISMVGPGDIVFLTIFFAAIYRFGMNDRKTYWLALPLLAATMIAVLTVVTALPALVPMSIAVIAANWRLFKLTPQEKWFLAIATAVVIALVSAYAVLRYPG